MNFRCRPYPVLIAAFIAILFQPAPPAAAQGDAYHQWLRQILETEHGVSGGAWMLGEEELPKLERLDASGVSKAVVSTGTGDVPFKHYARLVVNAPNPPAPWHNAVRLNTAQPIQKGDVLLFVVWVRGSATAEETPELDAVFELTTSPNTKSLSETHRVPSEWTMMMRPFEAAMDYPAGRARFQLNLGHKKQELRIGGIAVINFRDRYTLEELPDAPRPTYEGRERDAAWRGEAAARIHEHRMADLEIQVVDGSGNPVARADVMVRMQRHAFPFGSAVTAYNLNTPGPDGQKYREIVASNYNRVVFENDLKTFGWDAGRSNTGSYFRHEWTDAACEWLHQHDIDVRGHFITWAPLELSGLPGREEDYRSNPNRLRTAWLSSMEQRVPWVGERVVEWDAINHPVGWGNTTMEDVLGLEFYAEVMHRSRDLAPHALMYVNEGGILSSASARDDYERIIRYLVEHDAPPDGIGFMGHFNGSSLPPITEVYDVMERFAPLAERLAITELDVETKDEELQAEYLRDAMTIAFSHPQMDGILMWGFWEGAHWKPDAALYRRDWSIKPAGVAWEELVSDEWWTNEAGETGSQGTWRTRAFLGDHLVLARFDGNIYGKYVSVSEEAQPVTISPSDQRMNDVDVVWPDAVGLGQPYPLPAVDVVRVPFHVSVSGRTTVTIHDTLGREVARVVDSNVEAGEHVAVWTVGAVASGVYYAHLRTASATDAVSILVVR